MSSADAAASSVAITASHMACIEGNDLGYKHTDAQTHIHIHTCTSQIDAGVSVCVCVSIVTCTHCVPTSRGYN